MTSQWEVCPGQKAVPIFGGPPAAWCPGCAQLLTFVTDRIAAGSRYGRKLAADWRAGNWSYFQTFACRSVRGSTTHSEHAHSVAFDVRPFANSLHDDGVLVTDFDRYGEDDGIAFLHSIMDPIPGLGNPFQWGGGNYTNDVAIAVAYFKRRGSKIINGRVDAMHFEVDNAVTPERIAALDWAALSGEDDLQLTDKQAKAMEFIADHEDDITKLLDIAKGASIAMTDADSAGKDATPEMRVGFRFVRRGSLNLDRPGDK